MRTSGIRAKGTHRGSESRMVTGWSHDSNCAASTRYMKMSESRKAIPKLVKVRSNSLLSPSQVAR